MIDERAGESNTLRHATGKMVRIRTGKRFQADEPHEFAHFFALLVQYSARNQARFDVPAHSEPWKKVWVLENETAFRTGSDNFFFTDEQLAGIWKIQTGDESQQCGFPATARTDQRDQLSGGYGKRDSIKREPRGARRVQHCKSFANFMNAER